MKYGYQPKESTVPGSRIVTDTSASTFQPISIASSQMTQVFNTENNKMRHSQHVLLLWADTTNPLGSLYVRLYNPLVWLIMTNSWMITMYWVSRRALASVASWYGRSEAIGNDSQETIVALLIVSNLSLSLYVNFYTMVNARRTICRFANSKVPITLV